MIGIIIEDLDECDPEDELIEDLDVVTFDKQFDIYVDEFTTPLADDLDLGFQNEYFYGEYCSLNALGMLIMKLSKPGQERKIDLNEFRSRCVFEVDMDKGTLGIDASDVAEEIAKVLEKKNILKARGNTITWRKAK